MVHHNLTPEYEGQFMFMMIYMIFESCQKGNILDVTYIVNQSSVSMVEKTTASYHQVCQLFRNSCDYFFFLLKYYAGYFKDKLLHPTRLRDMGCKK